MSNFNILDKKVERCNCPDVLICDDMQINLIAMRAMIESFGIKVNDAYNGQNCLEKLEL